MPKIKTNRAAAKRFKKTGTGKFVYKKSCAGHMLTRKTTKLRTIKIRARGARNWPGSQPSSQPIPAALKIARLKSPSK